MRSPVINLLAVFLVVSAAVSTRGANAAEQANAEQLLDRAEQALAAVVSTARADGALSVDDAKAKPFWDGLKDVGKNLDNSKRDLASQDDRFFASLASTMAGYAQAEIALLMLGNGNEGVSDGMKTLGDILLALNENFSKEAARLREGGELTAAERRNLDKLIAQQDELLKKLEQVEANVAANNQQMKAAIEKMKEESRKIRRSRHTVGGFVGGFFSAHILYDWLWGWHWWWGPWGGWCPGYIDIGIIIWDDWTDAYIYDWALTEEIIDLAELDFAMLDDIDVMADLDYLDEGDFSFDGDIGELTEDIDHGWDDVSTDTGAELLDQYEGNFENPSIYDRAEPVETFQDYGVEDFGDDMGSMDFGGGFDDW